MIALLWIGLAGGQEPLDLGPSEVVDPPAERRRPLVEWDGGSCTQAQGSSGHHLYVRSALDRVEPVERPKEIAEILGRVTARACSDEGQGYACAEPAKPEQRVRTMERGQRVNGLLRLPVTRWLTSVTVTLDPGHLNLRYTLYAEGPGPGEDAWKLLCTEARSLIAAADGDSPG